ncbi:MAG: hypothetical protein MK086_00480 [Flavobacteriales bacterium]|nr:hypothetical protein [Flavobacteriales bacterium]
MKRFIGWITFSISIMTACFWAFWGIIESFHEGWYHKFFRENVGLMFLQYSFPLIITTAPSLMFIFKNRLGAFVFLLVGVALY